MKKRRWLQTVGSSLLLLSGMGLLTVPAPAWAAQNVSATATSPLITKGVFLYNLFGELGITLHPPGTSPYKDVATSSWQWGPVNAAAQLGLMKPDSGSLFGVKDPVSATMAANAIATLLNLSLPQGTSALQWLQQKGVFQGINTQSNLSLAEDLTIMSRLQTMKSTQLDYVPASWQVSQTQAEDLLQGMRILQDAPWLQAQDTITIARTFVLTPAALKIPQAVQQFKQLDQTEKDVFTVNRSPAAAGLNISESIIGYLNGKEAQSLQLFRQGNQTFANNGQGWQPIQQTVSANPAASQQLFNSSMLADVTAVPTATGLHYTASFNLSAQPKFVQQMVQQYAQFSNLALTPQQQTVLEQVFAKGMHITLQYDVTLTKNGPQPGTPLISYSQEQVSVNIPSSAVPMTTESKRPQFERAVTDVTFQWSLAQNAEYNHTVVNAPTGLPK